MAMASPCYKCVPCTYCIRHFSVSSPVHTLHTAITQVIKVLELLSFTWIPLAISSSSTIITWVIAVCNGQMGLRRNPETAVYTTVAILQTTICRHWWTWHDAQNVSSSGIDHGICFGQGHTTKCDKVKTYQLRTFTLHSNTVLMCSGPSLLRICLGGRQTRVAHTLHKGTSYFKTDQEGWRRTWLHCSWWGYSVCCTHIEWCIRQDLAHYPLHWLSLCALYYSGLSTLHQGRQC